MEATINQNIQQSDPKITQYIEDITNQFMPYLDYEYIGLENLKSLMKTYDMKKDGTDPRLLANLIFNGWLTFGDGIHLMPKLHKERCIINLNQWDPLIMLKQIEQYPVLNLKKKAYFDHSDTHKTPFKPLAKAIAAIQSGNYIISINQDFDKVMKANDTFQLNRQSNWMFKGLQKGLQSLKENPMKIKNSIIKAFVWELRLKESNELIAGDIGYKCGEIFTSISGFSERKYPSMGIIQLIVQGCILKELGFKIWDLGMGSQYKYDLGGKNIARKTFILFVRKFRQQEVNLELLPLNLQDVDGLKPMICYIQGQKQEFIEKKIVSKLSKRLNPQQKELEKTISLQDWSVEQITDWIQTKFRYTLNNVSGGSDLIKDDISQIIKLKKKMNRVKSAIKRLLQKQVKLGLSD